MSNDKRRLTTSRPLLAMTLIGLSALFWVLERDPFSWGFGWHYLMMVVLIGLYLRQLLHDNLSAILTSFYQIYYGIGMLVSAAIISSGAQMIEIGAIGTANGVFWLMLGFFILGMEATVLGYRLGSIVCLPAPSLRLPANVDRVILLAFFVPVLLLSLYVFVLTGGPVLLGIDRVTFWRTVAPTWATILPSLVTQTFFFVAFVFLWRRRSGGSQLVAQGLLVAYILIGLLVLGQKFSLFIIFFNIWLIMVVGVVPSFRFRMRHFFLTALIMGMLLLTVVFSYALDGRNAGFVLIRAALQAQLLWSVMDAVLRDAGTMLRPECYFGCDWHSNGMDYISYKYLPSVLYEHYKEVGTVLSGFMPALPIITFGFEAAIGIHIFYGLISGILQKKITTALSKRQPIYGFLLFKLQFAITIIWLTGNQALIPGLITVLTAILIYRVICVSQLRFQHASAT